VTPLPIRLLRLLHVGEGHDPLVGDLMEKYRRQPSTLRLWKEIAALLLVTVWRGVRDHPVVNMRAALVTPAIAIVAFILTWLFVVPVITSIRWSAEVWLLFVLPALFLIPALICGLISATLCRREWMVCALSMLLPWTLWVSVLIWNTVQASNQDSSDWTAWLELIFSITSAMGFLGGILLALRLHADRSHVA